MQNTLYRKFWLCWEIMQWNRHDPYSDELYAKPRCPIKTCHCEIVSNNDIWAGNVRKFGCKCSNIDCSFELDLDEDLKRKWEYLIVILEGKEYENYSLIDLDWELIPINERKKIIDGDYWLDAKISTNKKWEKQLMVLAWSKKSKDKTQLFLDSSNEKLWFDQNDTHPREVFSQVTATFKNSNTKLDNKEE